MSSVGFESATLATERSQIYALDRDQQVPYCVEAWAHASTQYALQAY